ncbi:uncharacterized protein LOC110611530 [Manihot esculenta]|uniref:uncharacterized protein LOC110611530 n=1 Tax=Manihot esculenta TaxID=3983 RepID=UPI000B5D18AC|nr:uncharacterized protein LOC110611530 [Manihot esculenta]
MKTLQKCFDSVGFSGPFKLGLLDSKHILIHFVREDDYHRCWLRQTWYFLGFSMRVSKWTPNFRPNMDCPIIPIWITLEGLPIHFFKKEALFPIANLIGNPLKGFFQYILYENLPDYCLSCCRLGHKTQSCISVHNHPEDIIKVDEAQVKPPAKIWVPKGKINVESNPAENELKHAAVDTTEGNIVDNKAGSQIASPLLVAGINSLASVHNDLIVISDTLNTSMNYRTGLTNEAPLPSSSEIDSLIAAGKMIADSIETLSDHADYTSEVELTAYQSDNNLPIRFENHSCEEWQEISNNLTKRINLLTIPTNSERPIEAGFTIVRKKKSKQKKLPSSVGLRRSTRTSTVPKKFSQ